MYVIREILNCKPGKVRSMIEKFGGLSTALVDLGQEPLRVLTDGTGEPSGRSSSRRESRRSMTSSPSRRSSWPTKRSGIRWRTITASVDRGRREIYRIVMELSR